MKTQSITKKVSMAAAVAAALTLALSGCSNGDPKEELSKAFDSQYSATSQSAKVHLDVDSATKIKFLAESITGGSDANETASNRKMAEAVLNSSVIYQAKSANGKPLVQSNGFKDSSTGVFVENSGARVVSLLLMNSNVFAWADVNKIADATGAFSTAQVDEFKSQSGIPAFVKDFINGKWIGLDSDLSKSLTDELNKEGASQAALTDEQSKQLIEKQKQTFFANATLAQDGDYIKATVPVKTLVNQMVSDAQSVSKTVFTDDLKKTTNDVLKNVKDGAQLNVYLKVDDDKLTQVYVNTADVMNVIDDSKITNADNKKAVEAGRKYNAKAVIDLSSETPDLNTPADYTKVTQKDLAGIFGG